MKTKKRSTLALVLVMVLGVASFPSVAQAKNTAEENAVVGALVALTLCAIFCGSDDSQNDYSSQSYDDKQDYFSSQSNYYEHFEPQTSSYQSSPVQPINSFYGDCHSPMGC